MRKPRPKLKIRANYMVINGETVEIDPYKTDLPDRCKLALIEAITGNKYEIVPRETITV